MELLQLVLVEFANTKPIRLYQIVELQTLNLRWAVHADRRK